jgi:hypothetical protein
MALKRQDIEPLCRYVDTVKSVNFIVKSKQRNVKLIKKEEVKG